MNDCDVALILADLADEGLSVEIRDGVPCVVGGRPTPWLMDDLKRCREAIIARLTTVVSAVADEKTTVVSAVQDEKTTVVLSETTVVLPRREWLWPSGHTYLADGTEPEGWHPVGAFWTRMQGEERWQVIEERIAPPEPIPEALRTHLGVHTVAGFRAGFHLPPGK